MGIIGKDVHKGSKDGHIYLLVLRENLPSRTGISVHNMEWESPDDLEVSSISRFSFFPHHIYQGFLLVVFRPWNEEYSKTKPHRLL